MMIIGTNCMVGLWKNRFRKSRKDYEDPEDVQKRATAKRDSRPLLFKFNEVCYNTKPITPQKRIDSKINTME